MTANTIVKNIVKRETEKFIDKHNNGKYFFMNDRDTTLEMKKSERTDEEISFVLSTSVNYVSYNIHGYIDQYGYVRIYMIDYKVWNESLTVEKTKLVHGEALDNFKF